MNELIRVHNELSTGDISIGETANILAKEDIIREYREDKSKYTLRRQDGDLKLFSEYLQSLGVDCGLLTTATGWQCITWGLVKSFRKYQMDNGYAISTINVHLTTIRIYAKLAWQSDVLSESEYRMIKSINGNSRKQARNIDEKRIDAGLNTRIDKPGAKKSEHTSINKLKANELKSQPDTPQGRRDKLLMCLLLDHGLRCGEVVGLTVPNIDIETGELKFYRPKVDKEQTHRLTLETWQAAKEYIENDKPNDALLLGSRKGGTLTTKGMSDRAITKRVKHLGETIGIDRLSAHDARHYAATTLAKTKTIDQLMEIFGWSSPAMAVRYIESSKVIEID